MPPQLLESRAAAYVSVVSSFSVLSLLIWVTPLVRWRAESIRYSRQAQDRPSLPISRFLGFLGPYYMSDPTNRIFRFKIEPKPITLCVPVPCGLRGPAHRQGRQAAHEPRVRSQSTSQKEKAANTGSSFLTKLAPQVGLEPTTLRLTAECSAIE